MKTAVSAIALVIGFSAAPVMAQDWTGPYLGLSVGNIDVDTSAGAAVSGDDTSYGIHGGYRFDFGQWVAGGELEYDNTSISLGGAATVDDVTRLKATFGYDAGPALIYLAAGWADVSTSLGDDTGGFYGVGLAYEVAPNAVLGLEILEHDFNNINGTGINADATSVSIRASFKF